MSQTILTDVTAGPSSKPMNRAPDHLQFAYATLVQYVFVAIRSGITNQQQLLDLANAMHNVSGILADYGSWTDDAKYRERYLRRYDQNWGSDGLKLEQMLDHFISVYRTKHETEKAHEDLT